MVAGALAGPRCSRQNPKASMVQGRRGRRPTTLNLERKNSYTLKFEKDGYSPATFEIQSHTKGGIVEWLTANLPIESKEAPKQAPPEPGALKG